MIRRRTEGNSKQNQRGQEEPMRTWVPKGGERGRDRS